MMVIKLNQKRKIMDLNDISEQLEEYERELARKNKIENMLIKIANIINCSNGLIIFLFGSDNNNLFIFIFLFLLLFI